MILQTKYNLGDTVYFIHDDKIKEEFISQILIETEYHAQENNAKYASNLANYKITYDLNAGRFRKKEFSVSKTIPYA